MCNEQLKLRYEGTTIRASKDFSSKDSKKYHVFVIALAGEVLLYDVMLKLDIIFLLPLRG